VTLILGLGVLLVLAGLALLLNLLGAADFVIRRVTSRSLGELAPGFAATRGGFRTYATLILAIGIVCFGLGLGAEGWSGRGVVAVLIVGIALFVIASIVAIAGEVVVYRRLKR